MKLVITTGLIAAALGTGVYFIGGWSLIAATLAVPAFVVSVSLFAGSVLLKPIIKAAGAMGQMFEDKVAA